jgi:hypothetical protein
MATTTVGVVAAAAFASDGCGGGGDGLRRSSRRRRSVTLSVITNITAGDDDCSGYCLYQDLYNTQLIHSPSRPSRSDQAVLPTQQGRRPYIIQVYTCYIPGIYTQKDVPGIYTQKDVPDIHSKRCTWNMTIQKEYILYIPGIYQVKFKNIPGKYLVYDNIQECTWYIPGVFQPKRNIWNIPEIYMVYIWYIPIQKYIYGIIRTLNIPRIYLTHDHLVHMTGIYLLKHLWVCSVPVMYPDSQGIYLVYTR